MYFHSRLFKHDLTKNNNETTKQTGMFHFHKTLINKKKKHKAIYDFCQQYTLRFTAYFVFEDVHEKKKTLIMTRINIQLSSDWLCLLITTYGFFNKRK